MKNLITTRLNVDLNNKSQIYLGKWCLSQYSLQTIEKNNSNILEYHWNSKTKFIEDSKYILKLYESYVIKIAKALNKYHKINEDIKYWETLIGEWFLNFTSVLYDRWELINSDVINKYNIQMIDDLQLDVPEAPNESHINYNSDLWNQYVFDRIIQFRNVNSTTRVSIKNLNNAFEPKYIKSQNLRRIVFNNFNKNSELFVFRSNFGLLNELLISLKKNKRASIALLPKFIINSNDNINTSNRNLKLNLVSGDNFEKFLSQMIDLFIPKSFIEDYEEINSFVEINMPGYSKNVVTSNAHIDHIPFIFWLARNRKNINNFVVLQNGGSIGSALVQCQEYLDQKISDTYITWGWEGDKGKNIRSLGASKIIKLKKKFKYKSANKKDILIVTTNGPRYHYTSISQSHGPQFIDEINKIVKLCQSLNEDIKKNLILRLNPKDFGWEINKKIKTILPELRIDNNKDFYKSIVDRKLLIFNYNGTSFLEALSLNIPLLLVLDQNIWHIRDSEKKYFKLLRDVGILHTSQTSIRNFIEKNSKNIEIWWKHELLQKNIKIFCDRFIKYDKDLIKKII